MYLSRCRVCDSDSLESAIDLGSQPWGNHFLTQEEIGQEPHYPLHVVYCKRCHTAQLNYTVRKEVMFSNHTYLSGITDSLSHHFRDIAKQIDNLYFRNQSKKRMLDIGSNDGTQLLHFQSLEYDVLGVESSAPTAEIANRRGLPTLHAFFNKDVAQTLSPGFDVINASGVFFHLEELHSVCEGIRFLLAPQGVFVVQCLYMKSILDHGSFDQIYHEHLLYYTLETLQSLLRQHDLEVFDVSLSTIHGGSLIASVSHKGARALQPSVHHMIAEEQASGCNTLSAYHRLAQRIHVMKKLNLEYLQDRKSSGLRILGMGAPVKGNTLLNTFGIGRSLLDGLVEKNRSRKGLWSPGQHLPILLEDELESPPDVYYVLAWNFRNEILKRNAHLVNQGVEFYFPISSERVGCVPL